MLQRLAVDNYRCLVDFELKLDEMSLLLGPNGSGKSVVLAVVLALRELIRGTAKVTDDGIFPAHTLTRWANRSRQEFEVRVALADDVFDYRMEVLHHRKSGRAFIAEETLHVAGSPLFTFRMGDVQLYDSGSDGAAYTADSSESALARVVPKDKDSRLSRFVEFMRKIVVCALHPPAVRAESKAEDPSLASDAANFADWYRHVVQESPDLVPPFIEQLKHTLEGGFGSMRLERVGKDTRDLVVAFDGPNGGPRYELRLDELSDGQRALIVLYGLVYLAHRQDAVLFLDEPDNYLALREIQPWLVTLEDAVGESVRQTVICSHNPEIIDYLGADCGVFLTRNETGRVAVAKPELNDTIEGLKLSEIIARGWEA